MNLIILAAGRGRRLKSKTSLTPKPLVKFLGKSILEYQNYATAGQTGGPVVQHIIDLICLPITGESYHDSHVVGVHVAPNICTLITEVRN